MKRMHRWIFVFAALLPKPSFAADPSRDVNFFIVGHEDDWQLFMNPNAYHDVKSGAKTVFIYTTAGDAGWKDAAWTDWQIPYFAAREAGADRAVRMLADLSPIPGWGEESSSIYLNGHQLTRKIYKNTVSYFLRLPDGGGGYWSLEDFRNGSKAEGTAIDNSTTYWGWWDLVETLREIIKHEAHESSEVWVNLPEDSYEINPGSHTDHRHTAFLVLDAVRELPCINLALFADYVTQSLPENLSWEDRQIENDVFFSTTEVLASLGYPSTWDDAHRAWLGRNYLRTVESHASCSF